MLAGSPASLSALTGISFNSAAKLLLVYTMPMFLLSFVGLWGFWRANRAFFWLAALTCVYFVGISAGAESFARFRVPIMPIYGILVANGIALAFDRFSSFSTDERAGESAAR
jgi:CHASE2 domain-containing sensor protein